MHAHATAVTDIMQARQYANFADIVVSLRTVYQPSTERNPSRDTGLLETAVWYCSMQAPRLIAEKMQS